MKCIQIFAGAGDTKVGIWVIPCRPLGTGETINLLGLIGPGEIADTSGKHIPLVASKKYWGGMHSA